MCAETIEGDVLQDSMTPPNLDNTPYYEPVIVNTKESRALTDSPQRLNNGSEVHSEEGCQSWRSTNRKYVFVR